MTPLVFVVLGTRVEIEVPRGGLRDNIAAIMRGFATASGPAARMSRYRLRSHGEGTWSFDLDGSHLRGGMSSLEVLGTLERQIVFQALAANDDAMHLHGAALTAPDADAAVLVLGQSGSGKTTLALSLMTRGFIPSADDVILIDPDHVQVRPCARAFHVDAVTRALLAQLGAPPHWELDRPPVGYFIPPQWSSGRSPVRFMLFPTVGYQLEPSVRALTVVEATIRVLACTTTLERRPRLALRTAARLAGHAESYAVTCGDVCLTAERVMRLLESPRARAAAGCADPAHRAGQAP